MSDNTIIIVDDDLSAIEVTEGTQVAVEVVEAGPQGPAWASEAVKAASEAARDAAIAAQQAAELAEDGAQASELSASLKASEAAFEAGDALASKNAAAISATNAAASATAAAGSATAAAGSASTASTKATEASQSAAAALASEQAADLSEAAAAGSASNAATSAATANTKAGEASTSATNAANSASAAAGSASQASTHATNAGNSASAAAGSASTASTKAAEAAQSAIDAANASRLTAGPVTTGAAGTNAAVSITGAAGAQVLNLTIPRGDKGEKGDPGADGASDWSQITGKPATINGYGITDAVTLTASGVTPALADLTVIDNSIRSGFHYVEGTAPGAPTVSRYHILHSRRSAGGGEAQIAIGENAIDLYTRGRVTGAWSAWRKYWHNANFDPATKADDSAVVKLAGSYADPAWITSLNYSKLTGTVPTWNQNTTGNAATATKLATARTLTIGNTGKSFDGSADVSWSLAEIGAPSVTGTGASGTWPINITGASNVSLPTKQFNGVNGLNQASIDYTAFNGFNLVEGPTTGYYNYLMTTHKGGSYVSAALAMGHGGVNTAYLGFATGVSADFLNRTWTWKKIWHEGTFDPTGKADVAHTHAIGDVTGLQTALDGKAASSHSHAIADVTGLQSALDGKMPSYGGSIVGAYPNIVFQDTELAVDAAGLWSFAIANGTVQFVKNTAAAGDFTSLLMALEIDGSGNVVAAGTVTATDVTITSDARLKSDVSTLYGALDMVQAMRGVRYTIDGKRRVGVIAQETQAVLPEVVIENSDGMLSVAYGNLVGVLIEAVKELKAEVDELKMKLEERA